MFFFLVPLSSRVDLTLFFFKSGGSYAGARAAHMRKLFPNEVFGAIASSAVTHAQIFYSGAPFVPTSPDMVLD